MHLRTGIGYDIHRFTDGRPLILGGVPIPYEKGLEGHSDADVLLHAVCDALLGALGKDDIGAHFPNTDAAYKDIASIRLLEKVRDMVETSGYKIQNIDTVLQAEAPQMQHHKEAMRAKIAGVLGLDPSMVNIKATTNEKLGAIGKGEGMAAFATVLLLKE